MPCCPILCSSVRVPTTAPAPQHTEAVARVPFATRTLGGGPRVLGRLRTLDHFRPRVRCVCVTGGLLENSRELLDSTHALLDAVLYLDDELLDTLREQAGIVPYVILQRLGDALLVPAGCAHQVRHLRPCFTSQRPGQSQSSTRHCYAVLLTAKPQS